MKKTIKLILVSLFLLAALILVGKGVLWKRSRTATGKGMAFEEKSFVIIIPSYNNEAFYKKNLSSVFEQKYNNFRVIYIDDASSDNTYQSVKEFIEENNQTQHVTLIHNEKNQGALANLYYAINSCKDNEIVLTVDGDDFLAHDGVLSKLNRVYSNPQVWMTYGNFVNYPAYTQKPVTCKKIPQRVIQNASFRKHEWVTSHLRTFYASLFKKIKKEDLLYQGKFYPMAWDLPMMYPMLEMSGKHTYFIKEVLYLYNRNNPINDHKINVKLQNACAEHAKNQTPYRRLKSLETVN